MEDAESCYVESLKEDLGYTGVGIAGETRGYGKEDWGLILSAPKLEVVEEDVFPAHIVSKCICRTDSMNERTIWLQLVSSPGHHHQQMAMR